MKNKRQIFKANQDKDFIGIAGIYALNENDKNEFFIKRVYFNAAEYYKDFKEHTFKSTFNERNYYFQVIKDIVDKDTPAYYKEYNKTKACINCKFFSKLYSVCKCPGGYYANKEISDINNCIDFKEGEYNDSLYIPRAF